MSYDVYHWDYGDQLCHEAEQLQQNWQVQATEAGWSSPEDVRAAAEKAAREVLKDVNHWLNGACSHRGKSLGRRVECKYCLGELQEWFKSGQLPASLRSKGKRSE